MSFTPRNYRIEGATLNYARLTTPTKNPYGVEQWEMQIATTDAAVAAEWRENHLNVKEKDGNFTVSLKRKTTKADGTENGAVRVVGRDNQPFQQTATLGNGSLGNVIVFQYPYTDRVSKQEKIATSLTAVQVTQYEEYIAGGMDFDVLDAPAPAAASDNPEEALF